MKTGTLNIWNQRKQYGIVSSGKANVYLKRHHVTSQSAPAPLKGGMEVEFDTEVNGMEIKSTCTFTRSEVV